MSRNNLEISRRALTWLLYCVKPLKLAHLATAASIDPERNFDVEQRLDHNENVFDFCGSLIKVNAETRVVEFSHISVTQFLTTRELSDGTTNPHYLDETEGNVLLMNACFMYLASPWFSTTLSHLRSSESIYRELHLRFQDDISFYSVFEWPTHARRVLNELSTVFQFFRSDSFPSWRELWELGDLKEYRWWERSDESCEIQFSKETVCNLQSAARYIPGPALYYAALFGFQSVASLLLEHNCNPNESGGPESYPLLAALENEQMELASLLLSRGADVNIKDSLREETAMHRAVERGNEGVVRFLQDKGADVTICNFRGITPLHLAVQKFAARCDDVDAKVIKLLANNARDDRGRTALHLAANLRSPLSVSMLVDNVDVNITDHDGRTPLHLASVLGDIQVVDILLNKQCNVRIADQLGYRAIHQAVRSGNSKLVAKLSEKLGDPCPFEKPDQLMVDASSDQTDQKQSESELVFAMINKHPNDILFKHILAEAYLKNGDLSAAVQFFDEVLMKDERNQNIRTIEELSHRVFCNECFKQITGIRHKCTDTACKDYDLCDWCRYSERGLPHPCSQHACIQIPSDSCLMALRRDSGY